MIAFNLFCIHSLPGFGLHIYLTYFFLICRSMFFVKLRFLHSVTFFFTEMDLKLPYAP